VTRCGRSRALPLDELALLAGWLHFVSSFGSPEDPVPQSSNSAHTSCDEEKGNLELDDLEATSVARCLGALNPQLPRISPPPPDHLIEDVPCLLVRSPFGKVVADVAAVDVAGGRCSHGQDHGGYPLAPAPGPAPTPAPAPARTSTGRDQHEARFYRRPDVQPGCCATRVA